MNFVENFGLGGASEAIVAREQRAGGPGQEHRTGDTLAWERRAGGTLTREQRTEETLAQEQSTMRTSARKHIFGPGAADRVYMCEREAKRRSADSAACRLDRFINTFRFAGCFGLCLVLKASGRPPEANGKPRRTSRGPPEPQEKGPQS